jgi:hypothetical protein
MNQHAIHGVRGLIAVPKSPDEQVFAKYDGDSGA